MRWGRYEVTQGMHAVPQSLHSYKIVRMEGRQARRSRKGMRWGWDAIDAII